MFQWFSSGFTSIPRVQFEWMSTTKYMGSDFTFLLNLFTFSIFFSTVLSKTVLQPIFTKLKHYCKCYI